jgi:putative methyltransferase (TIGR04325 family)
MPRSALKSLAKAWLPPVVQRWMTSRMGVRWQGDFSTWAEACQASSGYDSEEIFEKVSAAMHRVKRGEGRSERDSMVFEEVLYSFPLVAALQYAARRCGGRLRVLDFGGALGTCYVQNRPLLEGVESLQWCVVEQRRFVQEGNRNFANGELQFFESPEAVLEGGAVDFVLFSSSLQYVEAPRSLLLRMVAGRPRFLMYDRTPMFRSGSDRLTVQVVPPRLYRASYPCWILNRGAVRESLLSQYRLVFEGETEEPMNLREAVYCFGLFEQRREG